MKNEVRETLRELVDLLLRDEQEIRGKLPPPNIREELGFSNVCERLWSPFNRKFANRSLTFTVRNLMHLNVKSPLMCSAWGVT